MNTLKSILILGIVAIGLLQSMAQQKRLSPHETIGAVIDGNRITIVYGRPYTKNPHTGEVRKIWGGWFLTAKSGARARMKPLYLSPKRLSLSAQQPYHQELTHYGLCQIKLALPN